MSIESDAHTICALVAEIDDLHAELESFKQEYRRLKASEHYWRERVTWYHNTFTNLGAVNESF